MHATKDAWSKFAINTRKDHAMKDAINPRKIEENWNNTLKICSSTAIPVVDFIS